MRRELDSKAEQADAIRAKENIDAIYRRVREMEQVVERKAEVEQVVARLDELAAALHRKPDEALIVEALDRAQETLQVPLFYTFHMVIALWRWSVRGVFARCVD